MNRKNGFSFVELLIVGAIVALFVAFVFIVNAKNANSVKIKVLQGKLITEPEAGVVYEKTVADPLATAVVAIPRDIYYTEGTQTLHRVLVRVNNQAIVNAPMGTLFMRDGKGQDRIVDPIQPAETNWVDYGSGVAPEVIPAK